MTEEAAQRAGPARRPSNEPALAQARWNLVVLCAAVAVLLATMLVARAELATLEASIFRAVNDLPQCLYTVVWPFMQYGTFITIPALALIALLFRRFRLALAIALAGVGVYLVALVVKGVVDWGRPAALLTAVEERELFGADSLGLPVGTRRRRCRHGSGLNPLPSWVVEGRTGDFNGDRVYRSHVRRCAHAVGSDWRPGDRCERGEHCEHSRGRSGEESPIRFR